MSSLNKEQIFKKIIQNRLYREQILAEEHPNFEQIIKQIQKEHLQKQKMDRQNDDKDSQRASANQSNQSLQHQDDPAQQFLKSFLEQYGSLTAQERFQISPIIQNHISSDINKLAQIDSLEIQRPNKADNFAQNSQIPNVSLNDAQATINISSSAQNQSQVSFFLQHLEGQVDPNIYQKQQNSSQEATVEKQNLNLEGSSGESIFKLNQSNQHPQLNITVEQIPHGNYSGNSSSNTIKSPLENMATNKSHSDTPVEEVQEEEKKQDVGQSKNNQTQYQ
ncbi:hypothetical protein TTHERM_00085540 (macronuclear) [Tetrahymena thermophila SB210]|uniref:Uncharacterized protein n=1 Tax=Tetrahymena thermophila (strain SB210) TaxID=312017 RepID=Q236P4_TETTS|nr:hypothetical protein TTHERM_00085540 [Tetrahymena thermophila SB210]EAR92456.2 hypothetical protein TTHERM_00085540 [Tetrahymena thermophila SB210]|eukprot:XP_001012701.2 hypothetical protein TTHERM_00085540 [Tetrahymena thermophila SB210]